MCRLGPGSSTSAWRSVTTSPFLPSTVRRTHPEIFCEKSRSVRLVFLASRTLDGNSSIFTTRVDVRAESVSLANG